MSLQGIVYALSANSLVRRAGEMMQWLRVSTRPFRGPMIDSQHSQRGLQPPINYNPRDLMLSTHFLKDLTGYLNKTSIDIILLFKKGK